MFREQVGRNGQLQLKEEPGADTQAKLTHLGKPAKMDSASAARGRHLLPPSKTNGEGNGVVHATPCWRQTTVRLALFPRVSSATQSPELLCRPATAWVCTENPGSKNGGAGETLELGCSRAKFKFGLLNREDCPIYVYWICTAISCRPCPG